MLVNDKILVHTTNRSKKYYIDLGYKIINNFVLVCVSDLPKKSGIEIEVICDYCGDIKKMQYRNYLKSIKTYNKYSCNKCCHHKSEETYSKLHNIKCIFHDEDFKKYSILAENIKEAFNKHFYNAEKRIYGGGTQFESAFPLFLGLVPEKGKQAVVDNLVNDIMNKYEGHLAAGIFGTKYIMEVLSNEGRSDIAWLLATQTTGPSWLNMLENSTTLCESWEGPSSGNHIMLGSIDSWFYKTLGGIHVDEKDPGFKSIVIKPYAPDSLSWVKTSVQTVKGVVRSEWIRAIKNYKLKVSIPFGSEAIVYVFGNSLNQIEEGNISAKIAKNVNFLRMEGKYAVFHVESGEYNFNSTF